MNQKRESDISWTLGLGIPYLILVLCLELWVFPKDPDFITWLTIAVSVLTPIIALGAWEMSRIK